MIKMLSRILAYGRMAGEMYTKGTAHWQDIASDMRTKKETCFEVYVPRIFDSAASKPTKSFFTHQVVILFALSWSVSGPLSRDSGGLNATDGDALRRAKTRSDALRCAW